MRVTSSVSSEVLQECWCKLACIAVAVIAPQQDEIIPGCVKLVRPCLGKSALARSHVKSNTRPLFPNCSERHRFAALSPAHMKEEVQWVQD